MTDRLSFSAPTRKKTHDCAPKCQIPEPRTDNLLTGDSVLELVEEALVLLA